MRVKLILVLAVLCMATSSIMVRYCEAPSLVIAFYRMIFTAALALGLTWTTRQSGAVTEKVRRPVLGAGICLALHFAFWITSLSYTSIASSVLFTNLQVLFVWAMSLVFLKERVRKQAVLGMLIALTGSAVIAWTDGMKGNLKGDILALVSGFFFAIYLLLGRNVRKKLDIWPYTAAVSLVAALVLMASLGVQRYSFFSYSTKDFILFFLMALFPGIGGHAMINWSLKYIKAPIVAVTVLGESVGASLLGWLLLGEKLSSIQMAGGILILAGIYMAALSDFTSTPEPADNLESSSR